MPVLKLFSREVFCLYTYSASTYMIERISAEYKHWLCIVGVVMYVF